MFENTDTMRSRCRRWRGPSACSPTTPSPHEVETYNELIPDPGELSGTLFIELTDDALLREWLPKLRDIEFHVYFEVGRAREWVAGAGGAARRGAPHP